MNALVDEQDGYGYMKVLLNEFVALLQTCNFAITHYSQN